MTGWKRLTRCLARLLLGLMGALLLAAAVLHPALDSAYVSINDGRQTMEPLLAGNVLSQPVTLPRGVTQFSLQASSVKEAKNLTLTVTLLRGDDALAEQTFPLAKVKAKGRLIVDLPGEADAGSYTLRVAASGEGSVKLSGGEETPAQVDGETQDVGCALRVTCVTRRYHPAVLFSGGFMLLLALTPSGGKEAARHA